MPTIPVADVIHISSNVIKQCPHCAGFNFKDPPDIGERATHFIEQHNYKLLHVGQETINDSDGHPWQTTVAVVGK
jgi:hypothetical protein